MDIDLYRDGEQFSTYDDHNFLDLDESTNSDNYSHSGQDVYQWDFKNNLNLSDSGNPESSYMDVDGDISPPKNDFQKIMNDWQQLFSMDSIDDFSIEESLLSSDQNDSELHLQEISPLHQLLDLPNADMFDIAEYITKDQPTEQLSSQKEHRYRAGCKKIDLKAQRYIIEEDEQDVDVETVSDCEESSPILEANDLTTLLEQFEATEMPDLMYDNKQSEQTQELKCDGNIKVESIEIKQECDSDDEGKQHMIKTEKDTVNTNPTLDVVREDNRAFKGKLPKNEPMKVKIKQEPQEHSFHIQDEQQMTNISLKEIKREVSVKPPAEAFKEKAVLKTGGKTTEKKIAMSKLDVKHNTQYQGSTTSSAPNSKSTSDQLSTQPQNTGIILSKELIDRMKESGKRKPISVIPPIPTKKKYSNRSKQQESHVAPSPKKQQSAQPQTPNLEFIHLDHDYCGKSSSSISSLGSPSPYVEMRKKDSSLESAEEEEKVINVHERQPMVKGANGKLMVSLLKLNTIRTTEPRQKKKLNLEEYKKRREGLLKSNNNSQSCSPASSSCSSPLPEDENLKLIKHQEKLMRMAQEVLNTSPKSEKKTDPPVLVPAPKPMKIPPDMEKKELVSIGVNTDFKVHKNLDPLAPVEQLEEIKPLLKKASAKINCNSLITSLIENIPKVIDSCDRPSKATSTPTHSEGEHGEDKTIVYLPRNRSSVQTTSIGSQTNISLIKQTKAASYRRNREVKRRRSRSRSASSSGSSCSRGEDGRNRQLRGRTIKNEYKRDKRKRKSTSCGSSRSSRSSLSLYSSSYSPRYSSRSRSRSVSPKPSRKEREKLKEVEERRVIYVGRLLRSTTRQELRKRFQKFGPITHVSLHSRLHGDNYGFVTFANKLDAYEAIEHGNDDPYQPKFDLSFGGRRMFCKTSYSDLDNVHDEPSSYFPLTVVEDSFDTLLRDTQEKLRKRKA